VSYLDIEAMADAVHDLLLNEEKRTWMRMNAAEKISKHHVIDVGAPTILAVIESMLS